MTTFCTIARYDYRYAFRNYGTVDKLLLYIVSKYGYTFEVYHDRKTKKVMIANRQTGETKIFDDSIIYWNYSRHFESTIRTMLINLHYTIL